MRKTLFLLMALLPMLAVAALPPPLLRNSFTTNYVINELRMTNYPSRPYAPTGELTTTNVGHYGYYTYSVVAITDHGPTRFGTNSETIGSSAESIKLTVPVYEKPCSARLLYRTWEDPESVLPAVGPCLLTNIADNTTTTIYDTITNHDAGTFLAGNIYSQNLTGMKLLYGTNLMLYADWDYEADAYMQYGTTVFALRTNEFFIPQTSVIIGSHALDLLTNGSSLVAIGCGAGQRSKDVSSSVFVGKSAGRWLSSGSDFNIAIGQDALGQSRRGPRNVAIGRDAAWGYTNCYESIFIGDFAGENGAVIGAASETSNLILIGSDANPAPFGSYVSNSIAIGTKARIISTNQLVIGGTNANGTIRTVYIGAGVTNPVPAADLLLTTTGGAGANVAGTTLKMAGGNSSGSAQGGSIHLMTAQSGAAGSTINTLTTNFSVTPTGLEINATNGAPADAANISAWLPVKVNGTNFFIPLYK